MTLTRYDLKNDVQDSAQLMRLCPTARPLWQDVSTTCRLLTSVDVTERYSSLRRCANLRIRRALRVLAGLGSFIGIHREPTPFPL
jgi:hypothetical protein